MGAADYTVIALYAVAMIAIGGWVARTHVDEHGFFAGSGKLGSGHLGLSIAATDVGGGFSIGLGGLGFSMGLSGSWLLFTGLVGAFMTAVLLVPRVKPLGDRFRWSSYAEYLEHRFDGRVRLLAAAVSGLGYAAFVGGQILAGAKLASVAFDVSLPMAVAAMTLVIVAYTSLGGLEAVVLTDTVQWIVLLGGLSLFALPLAIDAAGGLAAVRAALPEGHLSLTAVKPGQLATWLITIVPIWFVANTLYQRMFAAPDVKQARRAWYIAGLFEWPTMALVGTALGTVARVLFPDAEPELAVPMLVRDVLPVGATGLVLAAYFSAIMSTADSCLLAAVGHLVTDIDGRFLRPHLSAERRLRTGRALTLLVGLASASVALALPSVLEVIMLSYAFMVSGLFVPTLAGLLWPRATARGALWSMLLGGTTAVVLTLLPELSPIEPVAVAIVLAVVPLVLLRAPPAGSVVPA